MTFEQTRIVLGRGAHADVRLPSRAVSETHAVLRVELSELSVVDEGSTNGTAVNGVRVPHGRKKSLKPGDRLSLPGFELTLEWSNSAADPAAHTQNVARKLLERASAGTETAPPSLELRSGKKAGRRWELSQPGGTWRAGRGEECEVFLDDPDCSREHALFSRDAQGVTVRDLGSKNGILVGGRAVSERRLRDGDTVQLGRSALLFADPSEALLRAFDSGADESRPWDPVQQGKALEPPEEPAPPAPPEAPAAPVEAPAPAPPAVVVPKKRPRSGAFDGVVVLLALVILVMSVAALYMLLRGGGGSVPR